ncbi:MAG: hypothetical protein ACK5PP_10460 [Acidimicrobiales bacterium]
MSAGDLRERNRYLRELVPPMVVYTVSVVIVTATVDAGTAGAAFWMLIPVIPLCVAAIAVYRSIRRADEYTRYRQYQAMAIGFGGAMMAAITVGWLGVVDAAPFYSGWLVFGVGMLGWMIGLSAGAGTTSE